MNLQSEITFFSEMAVTDKALAGKLNDFRRKQTEAVLKAPPLKL